MSQHINIVLFGNPNGMAQLGADSYKYYEKAFYKFYNECDPRKKFLISQLPDGTVAYTLLVYDLITYDNRPGGFFGMELRVKGTFPQRPEALVSFFQEEYARRIEGSILQKQGHGKSRYVINNFSLAEDIRTALLKDFQDHVDADFTPDAFALQQLLNSNGVWEKVLEAGTPLPPPPPDPTDDLRKKYDELKQEMISFFADRNRQKRNKEAVAFIDKKLERLRENFSALAQECQKAGTTHPKAAKLAEDANYQIVLINSVLQPKQETNNNPDDDDKHPVKPQPFFKQFGSFLRSRRNNKPQARPAADSFKQFGSFPRSRLSRNNMLSGVVGFVLAAFCCWITEEDKIIGCGMPAPEEPLISLCKYYEESDYSETFKDLKERIQYATKAKNYNLFRETMDFTRNYFPPEEEYRVLNALDEAAGKAVCYVGPDKTGSISSGGEGGENSNQVYIYTYLDYTIRNNRKAMAVKYGKKTYSMDSTIATPGDTVLPDSLTLWVKYPNEDKYIEMRKAQRLDFELTDGGTYHIILIERHDTIANTYTHCKL